MKLLIHILFLIVLTNPYGLHSSSLDDPITIIDIIVTDEVCDLSNGSISILATGGSQTLQYSIDNGISFTTQSSFTGLSSGDYIIFVSDGQGCSDAISTQIVDAPQPKINLEVECIEGFNMSSVNLTPFQNGIFPFTYNWVNSNGAQFNTEDLAEVPPGDYAVTITDRLGCSIDTSFTISKCCELTIECPIDTIELECLSELTKIDSAFLNDSSDNGMDYDLLSSININATEVCSNDITVRANEHIDNDNCQSGPSMITRAYSIFDGVKEINCEQIITIEYLEGIEILNEANDLLLNCEGNFQLEIQNFLDQQGGLLFESCHPDIDIRYELLPASINFSCEGTGFQEVEFFIEDGCGNLAQSTARIDITDNQPPVINCPTDMTISLEAYLQGQSELEVINEVSAFDNCSAVIIEHEVLSIISISCEEEQIDLYFNATDDCGNVSDCTVSITTLNETLPTINCPETLIINCGLEPSISSINDWINNAQAFDIDANPLDIETNFDPLAANLLECGQPLPIIFSTTDDCDRSTFCESQITLEDNIAPSLICPDNFEIEESNLNLQDVINQALVMDECNHMINVSYELGASESLSPCEEIQTIKFSASDACNNTSECETVITIYNNFEFELNCPDDITISLEDENWPSKVEFFLDQSNVQSEVNFTITNDFTFDLINDKSYISDEIKVNFYGNDICENNDECQSTIYVLPLPKVYVPNIITSNLDGNNDYFTVFGNSSIVEVISMTIYDKWGNVVFEKSNFSPNIESEGWNGSYENKSFENGVYTHHTYVKTISEAEIMLTGSIQTIK